MRKISGAGCILSTLLSTSVLLAQMHKVQKPDKVVRAVGVYEWTGDLPKPTASRLIPVSLAINGHLEDAGIYLSRPIPLALLPGNDYFLQVAGVDHGTLALEYARHLETADSAYEDGWFGYGTYHPPSVPRSPALRAAKTNPVIAGSRDSTRPHLTRQSDSSTETASSQSSSADPDRPHLTRKDSDGATGSDTAQDASGGASGTSADRPTMRRRNTDADTTVDSPAKPSGGDPSDDPDRPTLKRHTADDSKKKGRSGDDLATVTSTGSLNNDPDRPNLHRGKPAGLQQENDFPKLTGLPKNLHQMIAVSDAENRPEHDFARPWESPAERVSVLSGMQALARICLSSAAGVPPAPLRVAKPTATTRHNTRISHTKPPVPAPLLEEELRAYTLSYGGLPTFVYMAHTAGEGAELRYVTVVAQRDVLGVLKPAMQTTTDAMHLDRTPRMHLVDVVDADASNRASLLFELLAQNSRQFALYRVLGETAAQILLTGSTP